ncbi:MULTISPECIES: BLUF domain-containing protein [unclassified Paludibacterium]|uniref:BLUF domain-containing protein n=1 Tax=unclassified Paludibacterium TaxID=2618429 RepID=UPI001C04DBCC|nr:BLUF domain-containing protein [Paludibacterium sp. B53371]BEV71058.1 BLUF domain-containing protein [Paludibacterium sp. THUN1379]
MKLVHMIYCSAAKTKVQPAELMSLLKTCRENNSQHDITGLLLYREGSFFQILEGDESEVEALYDKISHDQRHMLVSKIICEPISKRDFGRWSMGFAMMDADELSAIPELREFFNADGAFEDLGEGRARTLLAAFNQGLWRAKLEDGVQIHQHA